MQMASKRGENAAAKLAFGAQNRNRLIRAYFDSISDDGASSSEAWKHVYRLLLWADQTTGLAHCYESDKSQPGKNWYGRSLAFHDWTASALGSSPAGLAEDIDWLFRKATTDLAAQLLGGALRLASAARKQRAPFEGRGFPIPGEDPELIAIVREVLSPYLSREPSPEKWQALAQRIRQYLSQENKRKNLVGEGFEDVLDHVIRRTAAPSLEISTRRLLHDVPGFNRARRGAKPNKVDLALIRPNMRTLVTAKWSIRADREKQFEADYRDYVEAESDRRPFDYVFITNEFDPARLIRACEMIVGNSMMFARVVHINTDAVRATYGSSGEPSIRRVLDSIDSGRLISLETWLNELRA
jgi:hypothetical protein